MSAESQVIAAKRWFDGQKVVHSPIRLEILGERIVRIGDTEEADDPGAEVRLFGDEAILCPGFIDTHSHSDFALADDPRAVGAVMQGITTQVIGQCGFSGAPLRGSAGSRLSEVVGDDPTALRMSRPPTWQTFAEYRRELEARRPAINVVPFVGHNTLIRASGHGDPAQVTQGAHDAVEGGARGISSGLSYQLGRQTTDPDVALLVSVAESHQVPYHTHMRYSGEETSRTLESTLELVAGRCGEITISHVFPRLRDRTTTAGGLLSIIEKWAPEFDSLTFDVTVYESGGTPWTHGLPEWASSTVASHLAELVGDEAWKRRVLAYLSTESGWATDWPGLQITKVNRPENRQVLGRSIAELAYEAGMAPEEYALGLMVDDGHFWVSPPNKRWSDLVELLGSDRCIPMVDGLTVDPTRADCLVALERSWNAFRRFLTRAVPSGELSLETALRKLTSDAATRLHLEDRGRVEVGAYADLTILNPNSLVELEPPDYQLTGKGIDGVMVNGRWVLDPMQSMTGDRPGTVV